MKPGDLDSQRERIVGLYSFGRSCGSIALLVGASARSVEAALRRWGITLRMRGPQVEYQRRGALRGRRAAPIDPADLDDFLA